MSVALYGFHYSVYLRIVRVVLLEKAVAYRHIDVDITQPRTPEYLQLHPFGRVPTLVHDDFVIYETRAITRYIDETFPGPPLQPEPTRHRARMTQIISIADSYAYWPLARQVHAHRDFLPACGLPSDPQQIEAGMRISRTVFAALESLIAPDGPIAGGGVWSLADFHLAPMIALFVIAADGETNLSLYPKLSAWWNEIRERSSLRNSDAGVPKPRQAANQ